ncbi:hypothetical protein GUH23_13060, partial [Xanthomonas citri pv. citri]|nr:hypothetical protein [Xanthomonas citri pv. citri]
MLTPFFAAGVLFVRLVCSTAFPNLRMMNWQTTSHMRIFLTSICYGDTPEKDAMNTQKQLTEPANTEKGEAMMLCFEKDSLGRYRPVI